MKHRILVIDDEVSIRELYKTILQPRPKELMQIASQLFDDNPIAPAKEEYIVDMASQGEAGSRFVK